MPLTCLSTLVFHLPSRTHPRVSLSGCCPPVHSPSAPSSSGSAKGGGAPWPGGAQTYSPSSTCRYRSLAQPATATARLSSISSHDSGFVSQDAAYSKPPSPMPSDITSQVRACPGPWDGHTGLMPASGYLRAGPPHRDRLSSLPRGSKGAGRSWSSHTAPAVSAGGLRPWELGGQRASSL